MTKKRKYVGIVSVKQIVNDSELDHDDRHTNPKGEFPYIVEADDPESAEKLILDIFHDVIPIHTLEDFEICVNSLRLLK